MSLFIKAGLLFLAFAIALSGYSQTKSNFYNKRELLVELKQSISNAINEYPRDTVIGAMNFRTLLTDNYFDSLLFFRALDTLSKYDNGKFSNYYIMIVNRMGYTAISQVLIRGYSENCGKEVRYYLLPTESKGDMFVNKYSHEKRVFKDAFEMKVIDELPESSDLLSISVYKKRALKTKIFQANNLTPEYSDRIKSLIGDDM